MNSDTEVARRYSGEPSGGDARQEMPRVAKVAATLALLVAAAAAYVRAFNAAFQFDDLATVLRNGKVVDLDQFMRQHLLSDWGSGGRAVTELTFALDHAFAGWSSPRFHATNILLHLATIAVLILFTDRVLRRAGVARPFPWALATAAIWGLHPIQTEAVTYVCQRAEVLAAFFALVSVHLLLGAEEHFGTRRGTLSYAGALLAFAAGIGSKTTAIVVPALFVLVAGVLPGLEAGGRARRWRRVALLVLPFLALALVGGIKVLTTFRGKADVGFDIPGMTVARYALTQVRVVLLYLRLLFWPVGQTVDWDVRLSMGLDGAVLASGMILAALIGGAVWLLFRARKAGGGAARCYRLFALGIGWFFVTLAPTSSLVPLVDLLFEHRVYLGSWGIVLALVALVRLAVGGGSAAWIRAGVAVAGLLVVVALGAATHVRNAAWETSESLWRDAVEKSPRKPRPHLNLGQALWERGEAAAAIQAYSRGLALDDGRLYPSHLAIAYGNLSAALNALGLHPEAIEAAHRGLRIFPDSPQLTSNLAFLYRASGDRENARRWAQRAIALAPGLAEPHVTLGLLLIDEGDPQGALREFRVAVAADPASESAAMGMAVIAEAGRDARKACEWWARTGQLAKAEKERAIASQRLQALRCGTR